MAPFEQRLLDIEQFFRRLSGKLLRRIPNFRWDGEIVLL